MSKQCAVRILNLASTFPLAHSNKPAIVADFCNLITRRAKAECSVIAPHESGAPIQETYNGIFVRRFRYFYPSHLQLLSGFGNLSRIARQPWLVALIPFFVVALTITTLREAKRFKADVIVGHWLLPQGAIAVLCTAILKKKAIIVCHGGGLRLAMKAKAFAWVARWAIRRSTLTLAVSEDLKKRMCKYLNVDESLIEVVHTGVDESIFKPTKKDDMGMTDDEVLLFVGRLEPIKGANTAIRAFALVAQEFPKLRLRVAGDGSQRKQLEILTVELGLADRVDFMGYVKHEQLPSVFFDAAALLFPSNVNEGLGLVVLEAMASGVPVIASQCGGVLDSIQNGVTGYLVEENTPQMFAEKIRVLLRDHSLSKQMVKNARTLVHEKHSRIVVEQKLAQAIRKNVIPLEMI